MKTETSVVLFADISGSTELYETLGDTRGFQTIGRCISTVSEVIKENNGEVIKTIGDEVMATFPAPDAAVLGAAAIQEAVTKEFPQESTKLQVCIGLHYGQILLEANDIFGDTVNIAARMVELANPGQILTSGETISALSKELGARTREIGKFPIKGKREMMRIYEFLLWEGQPDPELTLAPGKNFSMEMPRVYLLLRHGQTEIMLHEEDPTILMGRDPSHQLVIDDKLASRNHARIEYSNGHFVLKDHSTNGTFVLTHEGETIYIHRDQFRLRGNGQISLGQDFSENPTELVQFYLHRL
ncbi:adenylate/guanylate cyclase domain-containing protein [Acidobacteria bacterium AH-259-D05]|nr:adenylate/guanylate cyclase domain-containing protein [Acidobacteria bacterium AH-259-D05]